MKRVILPLLAALALPTTVNAEEIYLACKSNSQYLPYLEVLINTKTNEAQIFGSDVKDTNLSQSSGSFLITSFAKNTGWREVLNINRFNGRFKMDIYKGLNNEYRASDFTYRWNGTGKCKKVELEGRAF